jgi:hypothetical protein
VKSTRTGGLLVGFSPFRICKRVGIASPVRYPAKPPTFSPELWLRLGLSCGRSRFPAMPLAAPPKGIPILPVIRAPCCCPREPGCVCPLSLSRPNLVIRS